MPDPEEIVRAHAAAEKLKAEGNIAFQKQKWGAAVDVSMLIGLCCPERYFYLSVLTNHTHEFFWRDLRYLSTPE